MNFVVAKKVNADISVCTSLSKDGVEYSFVRVEVPGSMPVNLFNSYSIKDLKILIYEKGVPIK